MAINTFSGLVSAASEWLAREEDATLVARIPDFITLAEAKFNRELRCNQMEKRSTTSVDMTSDEPEFVTLPSDFQTMRRLRLSGVSGKPRLEFLNGTQADEFRSRSGNVAGQPRYFTIVGNEMELLPTPDQAYALEMVFRGYIPALTANNTTNWLLSLAPDLYLYATLLESAPYIKEDERIQVWTAGFQFALNGLNQLAQDQAYGSGPLTMRLSRVAP